MVPRAIISRLTSPPNRRTGLTPVQWVICVIASIGFAFDTYELLMLPLIVRPALMDLMTAAPDSAEFNTWVGILFYVRPLPEASSECSVGT